MKAGTPLAIHRSLAEPQLEHFIQAVQLSDRGTLLFFGRLHHESSMGPIMESGGGVTVVADEKGFIKLTGRSEEHTSELQSLMRISYAVFCLKKKKTTQHKTKTE